MKPRIAIFACLLPLLLALPALATQYWVRPGASNYGTGDGLSYANALGSATSFFSTVGTGDDVYLCGTITAGFTIGDNGVDANNYQIYDGSCPVGDGTYDPLFIGGPNPTTIRGFHLKSSSPLIGAGTCYLTGSCAYKDFLNRRHRRPPNIGAFATGFGDQK